MIPKEEGRLEKDVEGRTRGEPPRGMQVSPTFGVFRGSLERVCAVELFLDSENIRYIMNFFGELFKFFNRKMNRLDGCVGLLAHLINIFNVV